MGVNFIDVGEMMFGHGRQLKEFVTCRRALFRIKAFNPPTSRFAAYESMNHVFENPSAEALNDRNGSADFEEKLQFVEPSAEDFLADAGPSKNICASFSSVIGSVCRPQTGLF